MQKWEYAQMGAVAGQEPIVLIMPDGSYSQIGKHDRHFLGETKCLNTVAQDGWEVVAMAAPIPPCVIYLLRRPIP